MTYAYTSLIMLSFFPSKTYCLMIEIKIVKTVRIFSANTIFMYCQINCDILHVHVIFINITAITMISQRLFNYVFCHLVLIKLFTLFNTFPNLCKETFTNILQPPKYTDNSHTHIAYTGRPSLKNLFCVNRTQSP